MNYNTVHANVNYLFKLIVDLTIVSWKVELGKGFGIVA